MLPRGSPSQQGRAAEALVLRAQRPFPSSREGITVLASEPARPSLQHRWPGAQPMPVHGALCTRGSHGARGAGGEGTAGCRLLAGPLGVAQWSPCSLSRLRQ